MDQRPPRSTGTMGVMVLGLIAMTVGLYFYSSLNVPEMTLDSGGFDVAGVKRHRDAPAVLSAPANRAASPDSTGLLRAGDTFAETAVTKSAESKTMPAGTAVSGDSSVDAPGMAIDFVTIQGGEFMMGLENGDFPTKPRMVSVKTFDMARTPVTVEQYAECVTEGRCKKPEPDMVVQDCALSTDCSKKSVTEIYCNWGKPDRQRHPINCVSWDDVVDFANFKKARLPSEAEWEYAARSEGQNNLYPWGNDAPSCSTAVMMDCGSIGTAEVCSKSPAGDTKQGLCDMAGNVEQRVQDCSQFTYITAPNNRAYRCKVPSDFMQRGGSFHSERNSQGRSKSIFDFGSSLQTDARSEFPSTNRLDHIGFRLARSHR